MAQCNFNERNAVSPFSNITWESEIGILINISKWNITNRKDALSKLIEKKIKFSGKFYKSTVFNGYWQVGQPLFKKITKSCICEMRLKSLLKSLQFG